MNILNLLKEQLVGKTIKVYKTFAKPAIGTSTHFWFSLNKRDYHFHDQHGNIVLRESDSTVHEVVISDVKCEEQEIGEWLTVEFEYEGDKHMSDLSVAESNIEFVNLIKNE